MANITASTAQVTASVSEAGNIRSAYFLYRPTSESDDAPISVAASVSDAQISASLTGLDHATEYSVWAQVVAVSENSLESAAATFTTLAPTAHAGWWELPATRSDNANAVELEKRVSDGSRNYTSYYDKATYTAYWAAYPLISGHTEGTRSGSWAYDPDIAQNYQVNIVSGSYGVNYGSTTSDGYDSTKELYARGHQVPDADRRSVSEMQKQTYYATNCTPQIQNGFNGGIWGTLETGVRSAIPANDTLYVATGAVLRTAGGSEEITYIYPKNDAQKRVPVPNYYYKVLLKVKRSGGKVVDAKTIGFWLKHKVYYSGDSYTNYACSVDEIERLTGFDFFANLPEAIAEAAEKNSDWAAFQEDF